MEKRWFKSKPVNQSQFEAGQIDKENGILKGVVLCQVGEAKGHGVHLGQDFIEDLVAYANENHSKSGTKARFGHPAMSDTTMGKQLGTFHNHRVDGDKAVADLHLLNSSNISPTHPGMKEWVLSMADEKPDHIMNSIVFKPKSYYQINEEGEKEEVRMNPWGEPYGHDEEREVYTVFGQLYFSDLVEDGAATENLFGAQLNPDKFAVKAVEFVRSEPELLEFLQKNPGKLVEFAEQLGIHLSFSLTEKFRSVKGMLFGNSKEEIDLSQFIEIDQHHKEVRELKNQLRHVEKETEEELAKMDQTIMRLKRELNSAEETIKELEKTPMDERTNGSGTEGSPEDKPYLHNPIYIKAQKIKRRQ
jgi:hypothetical protein